MTPQEIMNKKFERGMGGYKVEDVGAFLAEIGEYVADLQEERADLIEKMGIIADKLEEYRADEDSIRAALLGAQKMADNVTRDAKKKANAILAEAHSQADSILADARNSLNVEAQTLAQLQREVSKFRQHILNMYENQVQIIRTLPYFDIPEPEPAPAQPPQAAEPPAPGQEKKADVFTLNIEDMEEAAGQNADSSAKKSYPELQFGPKYNLKRED